MTYTMRQLEIFIEAAQDGSFRKTADRLGISQPAVSKHIHALEASLGKTLFDRSRGATSRLSPHGMKMLSTARTLLAAHRSLGQTKRGDPDEHLELCIMAGEYLLENVLKPVIPHFLASCPHLDLRFQVGHGLSFGLEQVRSGQVDLALLTGGVPTTASPHVEILAVETCSLYSTREIADAVQGDVEAISATPFVLPLIGQNPVSWITDSLRRAGIIPHQVSARSQFGEVLVDLIRRGRGIGLLFDRHAQSQSNGQLVRIPLDIDPCYRLMVIGEKAERPAAEPCLRFLRNLFG